MALDGLPMAPPKLQVYWIRPNGEPKVLTAKNEKELDALTRIGWKVGDGKS